MDRFQQGTMPNKEKEMKKMFSFLVIILTGLLIPVSGDTGAENAKKVAVLPFTINSSENIGYIRDGVMDMLISRISVDGKIDVLGKSVIEESVDRIKKKSFSSAEAYEIGKRMKVDYIVWGSITKIGNSMSVDGKLIDIAANKSPVNVFVQSQGMDEVVPKINDFAKRIDMHILGQVPATFDAPPAQQAALPPAVIATPQGSQPVREAEPVDALRSKKQTFTSGINTEFINTPEPLSPVRGFWMSEKIDAEIMGMDVGDVNNDGRNEIVAIDRHNVMIYKKEGKKLRLIGKFGGKSYDRYLSVDVADIKGTDTKQIYVTSIQNGILNSFVLEYQEGSS